MASAEGAQKAKAAKLAPGGPPNAEGAAAAPRPGTDRRPLPIVGAVLPVQWRDGTTRETAAPCPLALSLAPFVSRPLLGVCVCV